MPKRNSWGKVRKLKSGRYQASHLNPFRERVNAPHTFSTKKSAEIWLASQRTLIEQGKWNLRGESAGRFYEYALRHVEIQTSSSGHSLRDSTKELYKRLLTKNLVAFHDLKIDAITKSKVDNWWHSSTLSGKITTTSKAYKLLHSVMNRALLDGHLQGNPCQIRGAHSANTGKPLYVPTLDEVGGIIAAIHPPYKAGVLFAAYGGLRYGEWSCLTRDDLELIQDLDGNYFRVHVTKAVAKVGNVIKLGKTKSEEGIRTIDLPSKLTSIISTHLLTYTAIPEKSLLFQSKTGGYIRHDVFVKHFNKAVADSGAPKTNPHALRHFGASQKVLMGMRFPQLKKWLGDKTDASALNYVHATEAEANGFREMPISDRISVSSLVI